MAVIGLPGAGVQPTVVGAPPKPSAALQAWVAQHYAKPLQAGVLQRLARNPTRAAQLTMPNVGQLLHPGGFDISRYHFPGGTATTPAVTAAPAPTAPANPYAAFPDYAQASLRQMDADQAAAQQNATTTAAWLAPALQALQHGQLDAQNAYGNALSSVYRNTSSFQGPAQVSSTSPGGIVSGPINASLAATQQATPLNAAAQQSIGLQNSFLGNLKIGDLGAGALGNLAYQAGQIPSVFAAKKSDYLATLDKALADAQQQATSDAAKLAEQQHEFGITNATTLRGQDISLARTTIGTTGSSSGLKPSSSLLPYTAGQPVPAGKQVYTDPSGGQYLINKPKPGATGKAGTGSGGYFLPGPQQNVPGTTAHRVPGGFRYLPDKGVSASTSTKGYQTLISKWSQEANKRLQGKRVQVGSTNTGTGTVKRYATQGAQHPEAVFSQMLAAGVHPKDAYRLVNANAPAGVSLDTIDVYNALGPSLGEKRARQAAISLTGQDPIVAANPGLQ